MQVTPQLLREWFAVFNRMYFENKLDEPALAVGRSRTRLGSLSWKTHRRLFGSSKCDYTIRLSNYYDVEERDFKNVLLHEMIHLFIESQRLKDTSSHGVVFRKMMKAINADGWNISVTGKIDESRRANASVKKQRRVVLAVVTKTDKHLLSVVNLHYVRKLNGMIGGVREVKSYSWHVSDDDFFASFPVVRTLRGRIVSADVFAEKLSTMRTFEP